MYLDHKPDYETAHIAAVPDNNQVGEPIVLSADCQCGNLSAWEATVYFGPEAFPGSWKRTASEIKVQAEEEREENEDERPTEAIA